MRKTVHFSTATLAVLFLASPLTHAIDALSPVERYLASDYNAEEYSDLDLDEQKRFAPASPGDSDLGHQLILKRNTRREPLRVELSTDIFWTDNIASTSFGEKDGFIWQTRLLGSWKPRIGNNLFADITASQSIYRYDTASFLDFERTDFRLGVVKITPDFFDALFFLRYEYARITAGSLGSSIYDTHRIRAGAHKVFLSTPKHTAYIALDAAYDLSTSPAWLERNEYGAHLGYTYQITDKLRAVLYYHFTSFDYNQGGRRDNFNTLGTELYWQLSHSTRIHASFTYVKNNSNLPFGVADYDSIQGGLGLGFTMRF